jgi:hypothetical protein
LLDWAGVERPVESNVEARWVESGAEKALFLFNHSPQPVDAWAKFRWKAAQAIDLETGAAVALPPARRLGPEEAWAIRLR